MAIDLPAINVDEEPTAAPTIAFSTGESDTASSAPTISIAPSAPVLPDNVIKDRANRADFALGDKSPGAAALTDQFRSGGEPQARQQAAAQADVEFRQDKLNIIKKAQSQDAPITESQVNDIMAAGQTPEANPNTVFEDKFASKIVTAGVASDGKNQVFPDAFDTHPEQTRENMQVSMAAISRKQQAKDVEEFATNEYSKIPWFNMSESGKDQQDKAGELAKGLLTAGINTLVNQRNLFDSERANSFLPGSNKLEQIQHLYLLPGNEFKPALMAAAGPGSPFWKENPTAAMEFIKGAVQFGTSDAYVDNLLAIGNIATLLPLGSILRGIGLLRRGKEVASPMVQSLPAAQAAEDVLRGSSRPPSVPAAGVNNDVLSGAENASEILSQPNTPPAQGYYVPKAGIGSTTYKGSKNYGEFVPDFTSEVKGGVPKIYNKDGIEVQLSRTPQEGHFPVEVTPGQEKTTFSTSRGSTYEVHGDNTTTRNKAGGHQDGQEGPQRQSEQTVYLNSKQLDQWSEFQAQHENPDGTKIRKAIDTHEESGKMGLIYETGKDAGKFEKRTMLKPATEPAKGLYPVELWDNGTQVHFGNKIVSVEKQSAPGLKLGPEIVAKKEIESRIALADIVKSQAETDPQDVLGKMGQHEAAVDFATGRNLKQAMGVVQPKLGDGEAIRRQIPSSANPNPFYDNSSSLTWRRAQELAEQTRKNSVDLQAATDDPLRVERLPTASLDKATDITKKLVHERYNRNSDAIADQIRHWDSGSNVYYIETRFTKKDGTLFDSSAQAEHYKNEQYKIGPAATVKQEGNQFYISHIQHVDETQSGVRDTLIVSENTTPQSLMSTWVNALTGKAVGGGTLGLSPRSSAYTVSQFQRQQRNTATHAPSILRQAIDKAAQDLVALGGRWTTNERQELGQILEQNRDYMSPTGDRGRFYGSAREFEDAFQARFNKLPSEKQTVAYETYTRLSDLDWTLREHNLLRDKARQGVRNYRTSFKGIDNETNLPSTVQTDWFNGKLVKDFEPLATANANVYVVPRGKFTTKYDLKDGSALSEDINNKLKSGEYQIVQVYNPREKPMMKTTGVKDDVHFVVVDKYEDKAVQFGENVEYRPGGHVIYQDQHYLKQPQIGPGTNGRETHFGDTTVKSFGTEAETNFWAERYNTARDLHRTGDETGLKAFFDAGKLPETLQDWKRMVADGTINLDHPFVHTLSGRDTLQSNKELAARYPGLKDTFSSYNLSQNADGHFLADRGSQLNTIASSGTEANPIYSNVPSRLFDPYTSLSKGMGQIVRARWMADYKMQAAESWIQEFGQLFDQSKLPMEKLRQNPIYYLNHIDAVDRGTLKANPEWGTAAMVSRKNIQAFIGSRDEAGGAIEGLELKLISKIDSIAGPKVARIAEERALPLIKNVPTYARTAAFDAFEGLYNPIQLAQQGMAAFHAIAISPANGMRGLTGAVLVRLFRHTEDPAILDFASNVASYMGWKKDEFQEALQGWKDSGISHIGGEVGMLNNVKDEPTLTKTVLGSIIDKGRMFFRAGDRLGRDVSWFTAYHDWRDDNPGRLLDNRAGTEVMSRFSTFNMNMTRASNAFYNEGVMSLPSQFYTWNARFTEQILDGGLGNGGELTLMEKARVLTMYSAMFGIPSTLGAMTWGFVPNMNYDDIRQYALTHNIPMSNKGVQGLLNGLPEVLLNTLTGHDTSLHRFSPDANQLKDIQSGKIGVMGWFLGASGQVAGNIGAAIWPAYAYAYSALSGDERFPTTKNDFYNAGEIVSSFNNAEKMIVGLNTGKFISKTEGFVTDVDTFDSMMMGVGLTTNRANDAYEMVGYNEHLKKVQDKFEKLMIENWKLGFQEYSRGNHQGLVDYMTRIHTMSVMGGFTETQYEKIFRRAVSGTESLSDQVNEQWLKKGLEMQQIPAIQRWFENRKK